MSIPKLTLEQIIRETQCLVGTEEMNEVIKDIRKEFGEEGVKQYEDKINELLFAEE